MEGLKRGTVSLLPHQETWSKAAETAIKLLKELLGDTAVEIQHVGSTAVPSIHAKPIIDLALGVRSLPELLPYTELLAKHGILFRGEDCPGQLLFIMGDFENETRTHHIHAVVHNKTAWNNYLCFRDYLNAFPEKAAMYDACKQKLAARFPDDRSQYTERKQDLINRLLKEAGEWKKALPKPPAAV